MATIARVKKALKQGVTATKRPRMPVGWAHFYRVARRIPRGSVCTYGQLAELAGRPRSARHVGYAMAALRGAEHDVPWHRVLGARPRKRAAVSILDAMGAALQRLRLEAEGIEFDERGTVELDRFGWQPRHRR